MGPLIHDLILWMANILDLLGALVLVTTSGVVFFNFWRRLSGAEEGLRLSLARGLAFGLEFKLGGEILRTVAIRSLNEVYVLGAIVILRGAMSFLIHLEIRHSLSCMESSTDCHCLDSVHKK
jgi:uncharacterized membrane protein